MELRVYHLNDNKNTISHSKVTNLKEINAEIKVIIIIIITTNESNREF
jgi:hypothetical protein